MTKHPQTRLYDSMTEGTVQNNTDPIPTNAEAIAARKRAIREGRLIIVDPQDPGRTPPAIKCTGCETGTPLLLNDSGATPPVFSGPNTDGAYTINQTLPGSGSRTNDLGYSFSFNLDNVLVTPVSGSCKVNGSGCDEAFPCGFVVDLVFSYSCINLSDDGVTPTMPTVQIRNPLTGLYDIAPMTCYQVLPSSSSDAIAGLFAHEFHVSVPCDDTVDIDLDIDDLDPVPGTGSWSAPAAGTGTKLRLSCGACVRANP